MDVSPQLLDSKDLEEQVENLTCPTSTVHHFPSPSKTAPLFFFPQQDKMPGNISPMDIEPLMESKHKFSRSISLDSKANGTSKLEVQMPASSTQQSPIKIVVGQGQTVPGFVNADAQHGVYNTQLSPTSTTITPLAYRRMSEDATPEQDATMIDTTNPKSVFVPCKVCGDRASGFHYGVTSCEGCKGFFRRSIQKQIEYRCLRDGKCMVIRLNRNRCQFCRFKKCLAVGMSRESVRYGRVPRNNKKDQQPNSTTEEEPSSPTPATPTTTTATPPPETAPTPPQDTPGSAEKRYLVYDLIVTVSQAHHAHCALTVDRISSIQRTSVSLLNSRSDVTLDVNDVEKWEEYRCSMFDSLARFINPTVHKIVEFCKRVPGFLSLAQDSQLVLIKQGFLELWLLHMCRMLDINNSTLTFQDGSTVSRKELDLVLKRESVSEIFRIIPKLVEYELNDTEIALLCAYTLSEPTRKGLLNRSPVEEIHQSVYEAMELQIRQNHRANSGLFKALLSDYSDLNSLGTQLLETLGWFRSRWDRMQLPPLFSEIFDIPKRNEDDVTT